MKKFLVIILSTLVLSTGICLPIVNSVPINTQSKKGCNTNNYMQAIPQNHHEEIEKLYFSVIDSIKRGEDPTNEMHLLLQYTEIQDMLSLIADNESITTINILLSNRSSMIKSLYLIQQVINSDEKQHNEFQQKIKGLFDTTLSLNINSIDDIWALEIVQSLNISKTQLLAYYTQWTTFLLENPSFTALFNPEEFDLVVYALILFSCLLVYVFISSGILTAYTTSQSLVVWQMGVGMIESIIFGIGMSGIINEIRFSVLENRSIITWIAEELIFKLLPFLSYYKEGIKGIISSTLALVLIAGYFVVYNIPIIAFVAGGFFSLAIPILTSLMIYYLYDRFILSPSPSLGLYT